MTTTTARQIAAAEVLTPAAAHGAEDARDAIADADVDEDFTAWIAPGQLGADEGLINAIGLREIQRRFLGRAEESTLALDDDAELLAWLRDYSRGYREEIEREIVKHR